LRLSDLPPTVVAETLNPASGVIDLWWYPYGEVTDPALLAEHHALMTPEERARHDRFIAAGDRALFLATRALVRTTLSRYAQVAPAAWRFGTHARGKPHIASPASAPPLHFNLSNTQGLVVCAVSTTFAHIGVDTEPVDRRNAGVALADRYFSATEMAALNALPPEHQQRRFLSYWTLKESYIKARGLGLAIPLDQFSFLLDDGSIAVAFDPRLGDDAMRWRFALIDARPNHLVALGVDTGGADWSLRARQAVPLRL
jgi:4'-phosphopantetheinyl transferase